MNPDAPENDEQAEQALRHDHSPAVGHVLTGIYQCERATGSSVLEAYEAALLVLVKAQKGE